MIHIYCNDLVDILTETKDKYQQITSTAVTEVKARVTEKNYMVRNAAGDEVVASGKVDFPGDYDISESQKIRYKSRDHVIIRINRKKSFTDILMTECYIK